MAQREREARGAQQAKVGIFERLSSWADHHQRTAVLSLLRLLSKPASTLLTCLVIAIAMSLPASLYIALSNLERVSGGWEGAARLSLFLQTSVSEEEGRQLATKIDLKPEVASVNYVSREQALAEYRELSGYAEVLERLDDNPLPAVIVVTPRDTNGDERAIAALRDDLAKLAEVENAQLDMQWLQRLNAILKLARTLTTVLAVLLAVGVLLVIGNTIKLAIESRREEILVVKLVGGSKGFVRRPFLYTGFWYGLGGGMLAWILVLLGLFALKDAVSLLAGLYGSEFVVSGLGVSGTVGLWFLGGTLGLIGAWVVVGRQVAAIEPR